MKVKDLDSEKLVQRLLMAPLASLKGKHKWMRSTFADYVHVEDDDLEGQYVKDIILLDTRAIIEKWYGGEDAATMLILQLKENEKSMT
jgi:hypothetical protein